MTDDETSDGTNGTPPNDSIAGTGRGIPDDALAPGEDMPAPPSEAEQRRIAAKLGVELPDDGQS